VLAPAEEKTRLQAGAVGDAVSMLAQQQDRDRNRRRDLLTRNTLDRFEV